MAPLKERLFGLSTQQTALVRFVSYGMSCEEAGQRLGMTYVRARKELSAAMAALVPYDYGCRDRALTALIVLADHAGEHEGLALFYAYQNATLASAPVRQAVPA